MKAGDRLAPLGNSDHCVILEAPRPPAKWRVRYDSGRERLWSKSHLKKYYMLEDESNAK